MSKQAIETVIGKIVLDAEFRKVLLANPDQLLAGFNLTETEKVRLKTIDAETMDVLANILNERSRKDFKEFFHET
jgi:hypothetical protein